MDNALFYIENSLNGLILAFVYLKFFSEIYPYFYFIFYLLLCVVTNKFAHGVTKFARDEM